MDTALLKRGALVALVAAFVAAMLALGARPALAAYTAQVQAGTLLITGTGASDKLALRLAAGAPNTQTFTVRPTGLGTPNFAVTTTPQQCVTGQLKAEVVAVPQVLFTDSFATSIDDAEWTTDNTAFDPNVRRR